MQRKAGTEGKGEGVPPTRWAERHSARNPDLDPAHNPDSEPLEKRIEIAYRRFLRCHPGRLAARASAAR